MTEFTIKLHDDDHAYLELEAEETGLEPSAIVAMLVRKARKASEKPDPIPQDVADKMRAQAAAMHAESVKRQVEEVRRRIAEKRAKLLADLEALEEGESSALDIPDAPSDEGFAIPEFDEALLREHEPVLHPDVARAVAPRPNNTTVGSMTSPVGLRNDLKGGDVIGDPMGNIVRRNFSHLK